MLLACKASDAETLIRRVVDRGREPANVAEARVRKNIPDTARSWAIVGALAEQLRGSCAEVDAMQVCGVCLPLGDVLHAAYGLLMRHVQERGVVLQQVEAVLERFW